MRLVSSRHFDFVAHLCVDWRKDIKRCFAYHPYYTVAHGEPEAMRFCMDQFEAPNIRGEKPLVMRSFPEAEAFCAAKGKRVCSEAEWETACESGDERPWQYGWSVDKKACNSDKAWREVDEAALMAGGDAAKNEVRKLWQGLPSGQLESCRTPQGIYDLMGNVEEWVSSSRKRRYRAALMGGFWAKPWTGCRGTNDAHDPANFRFYEVGFRCCKEAAKDSPDGAPQGPSSTGQQTP